MKPEIKQKWLDALRSGAYQQGQRVLRTDTNKFCCLGVLCNLIDPTAWSTGSYFESAGGVAQKHRGFFESMPSGSILAEAGLSASDAEKLAEMNDGGQSFALIAKYIEEVL